ncbi:MAG: phosphohistidine phosphatase SixA [Nitrosopumilaceae archaeon]|nr:phosphohistidine phosphatase SixA [Nitrosopumilaceae archaeon]
MEIYILRHGKAEERPSGISSDAKRRLTESGRSEMEQVASGITALGIRPDRIISSPLVRARETAEIIRGRLLLERDSGRSPTRVGIWQELKPESDVLGAHGRLAAMAPDSGVMLVGHEPHLSSLASSMITRRPGRAAARDRRAYADAPDAAINLKKGGLAIIRANADAQVMRGFLRSLMTPKQLRLCRRAAH